MIIAMRMSVARRAPVSPSSSVNPMKGARRGRFVMRASVIQWSSLAVSQITTAMMMNAVCWESACRWVRSVRMTPIAQMGRSA